MHVRRPRPLAIPLVASRRAISLPLLRNLTVPPPGLALLFLAQRLALKLVPVALEILEPPRPLRPGLFGREVRVLEHVARAGPRVRVVQEHGAQQVKGGGREPLAVLFLESRRQPVRGPQQLVPRELRDAGPLCARRRAQDVVDFVELVDLAAVAGEDCVPGEDFDEHARRRPDVHAGPVLRLAEEEFGRSVPDCDDAVGVVLLPLCVFVVEACEAEISQFELAVAGYQNVGGFDVAVENSSLVEVVESFE